MLLEPPMPVDPPPEDAGPYGEACTTNADSVFREGDSVDLGFMVVGLGLAGMEICFFALLFLTESELDPALRNLSAFGFGASSIALFARVAGWVERFG